MQSTQRVFMVRPAGFGFNAETAVTNSFQQKTNLSPAQVNQKALEEFNAIVPKLTSKGVDVDLFDDRAEPVKPDAIFPNNWISLHADGTMVLYPMCTPNRRHERRNDIVDSLRKKFRVTRVIDLSHHETENKFLEGTGSIVFDHVNKIAYACLSPRTDKELLIELCTKLKYKPVYFYAHDQNGMEIYHTNVMMCVGDQFAVICLNSISDQEEKESVLQSLRSTQHDIIEISFDQMNRFAGNMLLLTTGKNKSILVMSQSALDSLTKSQRTQLENYAELVPLSIPTIETIGGGSARCMIAEIFLPVL